MEPDDSVRHFVEQAITRAGHETISVDSGEAAAAHISEKIFDRFVIDAALPDATSILFLLQKSCGRGVITSAGTAIPSDSTCAILPKPFTASQLLDVLELSKKT